MCMNYAHELPDVTFSRSRGRLCHPTSFPLAVVIACHTPGSRVLLGLHMKPVHLTRLHASNGKPAPHGHPITILTMALTHRTYIDHLNALLTTSIHEIHAETPTSRTRLRSRTLLRLY